MSKAVEEKIQKMLREFLKNNPNPSLEITFLAGINAAEQLKEEIAASKAQKIKAKQDAFYNSLIPFVPEFGKDMVRRFYDYWSEPNKSMTKLLWELKPTWEAHRRLKTWQSNEENFAPRRTTVPSTPSEPNIKKRYSEI